MVLLATKDKHLLLKVSMLLEHSCSRSHAWPHGLPWLEGKDKIEVDLHNELAINTFGVCHACVRSNTIVTVENPHGSTLWLTDYYLDFKNKFQPSEVTIDYCMWGEVRLVGKMQNLVFPIITGQAAFSM
jgi:hypothetical protein